MHSGSRGNRYRSAGEPEIKAVSTLLTERDASATSPSIQRDRHMLRDAGGGQHADASWRVGLFQQ